MSIKTTSAALEVTGHGADLPAGVGLSVIRGQ
jgi:hypothetical protein